MTLAKAHLPRRWRGAADGGAGRRRARSRPFLAAKALPGEAPLELERARVPRPIALRRGQALGGLLDEMGLCGSWRGA